MEGPWPAQSFAVRESIVSTLQITVNGKTFEVEVGDVSSSPVQVVVDGQVKSVSFSEVTAAAGAATAAPAPAPAAPAPAPTAPAGSVAGQVVAAPMPGKILSVAVKVGDAVKEGDTVCTLEAMKMEMPISSTASGKVAAVHVSVGQNVANADPLVTIA
jgi:biotin carboxyl carrier protein